MSMTLTSKAKFADPPAFQMHRHYDKGGTGDARFDAAWAEFSQMVDDVAQGVKTVAQAESTVTKYVIRGDIAKVKGWLRTIYNIDPQ